MSISGPRDLVLEEGSVAAAKAAAPVAARSPWQLFWRRLRRDRVAMTALAVISVLVLIAMFAPLIVQIAGAPNPNIPISSRLDQNSGLPTGPSSKNLLGVDQIGRDVFARVIYGARVSLTVALLATAISVVLGTALGLIAGFYRGGIDTFLSRSMDIMLAFPVLLLALGLAASCSVPGAGGCLGGLLQPGLPIVVAIIAFAGWPYVARIMRGQVLSLREKEFIEASRSLGASNKRIMFKEVLPNLVAPIIVYSSLIIPANILFEAALSFLGVGVQAPQASWGAMISDATSIPEAWGWFMLSPGIALLVTVLAFNLLGDGLQDALNPRSNR